MRCLDKNGPNQLQSSCKGKTTEGERERGRGGDVKCTKVGREVCGGRDGAATLLVGLNYCNVKKPKRKRERERGRLVYSPSDNCSRSSKEST